MFCVVQKVENKKVNAYGGYKELEVDASDNVFGGAGYKKYSYHYSGERFERPIKDAYKISVHKSYRENGSVKKKQWVIGTVGYYDFLSSWTDYITQKGLEKKLEEMGISEGELWDMLYEKLKTVEETVKEEFKHSEEGKTQIKHQEILEKYRNAKEEFENKYGDNTFDYCYDVFGTLRNEEYLNSLKTNYESKQREYQNYESSYQKGNQSNYNYDSSYNDYYSYNDYSSYSSQKHSNYTDDEKGMLKKIYKVLAVNFHPDKYKEDDGEIMKLVNRLKGEWGI